MKRIINTAVLLLMGSSLFGQDWTTTGNFGITPANWLGTQNNAPLNIRTANIQRMRINGNAFGYGVNTSGFIGIGTTNPASPIHIVGNQTLATVGWRRGITLSNSAALVWDGTGGQGFMMAHPSSTPTGNFYAGVLNNLNSNSAVNYAYTVHVNQLLGGNPQATTQFFKNVLVLEANGTTERSFGVNVQTPGRVAEIRDMGGNNSTDAQLRLSTSGTFTDFRTSLIGNLLINPSGQRVGINMLTEPTATMDLNGDARIRNVQTAVPDALFVGTVASNAGDLNVRRLDFTGNSNQVLLGNGTWGPAPGALTANNGVVAPGGVVQLGAQCNNLLQILISSFTSSRAVFLNGNSFWLFSGAAQNGGIGLGAQPASSGLCGVGNTVEISANNQSAYGNTDASGLRFTKLTSNSPVVANGTNGVDNSKLLTVDVNGDVVLTDIPSSSGNGFVDCADNTGAANLLTDSKVNLNNQNLFFESNDLLGENHIGMGYDCGNVLPGKLSVQQVHPSTVGVSTQSIYGVNSDIANVVALTYSGVYGEANGLQNPPLRATNIGGDFRALNGTQNFGVFGAVEVPASYPAGLFSYNVGGNFRATGPGFSNVGGLFQGYGGSNVNYGIHTSVSTTPGSFSTAILAIAPLQPNHFAAHFTGDVYMNGVIVSTSDENLKENVAPLNNALDVISSLNPVSFEFKQTGIYDRMNMPEGNRFGLIAQEVQPILPELVKPGVYPAAYDSLGNETDAAIDFLTLDYESLIPIIIKGMQEQQEQINEKDSIINDLNNRLTNLENCLSGLLPILCQISNSSIEMNSEETAREIQQAIDVHLSDKSAIILNQNVPNPFAERSVITYSIPANVEKAQIIFYDAQGKLINAVDVIERGEGQLNVFASDLSTGVYTYSLVADGKVVATKRMMKQ